MPEIEKYSNPWHAGLLALGVSAALAKTVENQSYGNHDAGLLQQGNQMLQYILTDSTMELIATLSAEPRVRADCFSESVLEVLHGEGLSEKEGFVQYLHFLLPAFRPGATLKDCQRARMFFHELAKCLQLRCRPAPCE